MHTPTASAQLKFSHFYSIWGHLHFFHSTSLTPRIWAVFIVLYFSYAFCQLCAVTFWSYVVSLATLLASFCVSWSLLPSLLMCFHNLLAFLSVRVSSSKSLCVDIINPVLALSDTKFWGKQVALATCLHLPVWLNHNSWMFLHWQL